MPLSPKERAELRRRGSRLYDRMSDICRERIEERERECSQGFSNIGTVTSEARSIIDAYKQLDEIDREAVRMYVNQFEDYGVPQAILTREESKKAVLEREGMITERLDY